jgi:signal transduction histidine kinase/CheY-like chemotaxis protein
MQPTPDNSFLRPMRGKVIAASLLACVAIGLALIVTYFSFFGLLDKMDELSMPNSKLKTLNNLFEQITRLDQEQRADAIKNPSKSYKEFLQESKMLTSAIDSLRNMNWEDKRQIERLEAMKRILHKRDFLLIEYLKLKSDFVSNKKYSIQLDSLADILIKTKPARDSSVRTTQKKTTTTTYLPETEEKKQSLLNRIFGGKKKETTDPRVEVKEEVSIQTDTLAIAKQDNAIQEVSKIMKTLEKDQRQQTKQMLQRELELIRTNIVLINQLLSILQEVENEEIASIERKNAEASAMVNLSIKRIGLIMIIFFLLAAVLMFLIMTDISKSNYYRLQLITAKEHAEQLSQVKQRFLANMSHEIRTPLQSIIGFSEQLKNNHVNHPVAIEAIQSSSEHLLHIVNEILDYSRIESDQFTIEYSPFNLSRLIEEVAAAIQIHAEKKGLQFIVDAKNVSNEILTGDAFRLRQVLYNLLGNAVKFTNKGFVKFEVETKQELAVICIFHISDSGIGIAQKDTERIFTQFEQGDVNIHKQYGGAGLGLSIVKKLIDIQGGTIKLDTEEGKGSSFTVELSFQTAQGEEIYGAVEKPRILPLISSFQGRILLVDDDPLILRLCSILLEKNKVPFKSISQASQVLEEDLANVSFILLDIRMPEINGIELCKVMRPKTNARIIALTAHVLPQEQKSILEAGFDGVLTKPFREKELLQLLEIPLTTSLKEESIFDLSALKKLTMGDAELLQTVLNQFIEETEKDLCELQAGIIIKDNIIIREIIHKLSGRVGQIGALGLSKKLQGIEAEFDSKQETEATYQKMTNSISELDNLLSRIRKEKKLSRYCIPYFSILR